MRPLLLALLVLAWLPGCDSSSSGGGGDGDPPQSASFPLHVSSDGRTLEDNRGTTFLINGDTGWSLMVGTTKAEAQLYLDNRSANGFNAVIANLIDRGFGGPPNAEGNAPFASETNWTTINPAYFDHAAWVIDRARERGILMLLKPAHIGSGCNGPGWCDQMRAQSVEVLRSYGRFLGDRFRNHTNIVWVNGGDADARRFGLSSRVNAIAEGIRERAPNHLQTAHCSRGNSAIECYDEPWLDVNSTYSSCDGTLRATRNDWERTPPRVFFYIEGRYENEGASLGCLIDQHAWSVLGGSTGHIYGNGDIWEFPSGWQNDLDTAGVAAMRNLARLFRSRSDAGFVPDHEGDLLQGGGGNDAIAAVADGGASLLVYVPSSRSLLVDVSPVTGGQARAWWFDPVDGVAAQIATFPSVGVQSFRSPGRRILVIDDMQRVQGPPGG